MAGFIKHVLSHMRPKENLRSYLHVYGSQECPGVSISQRKSPRPSIRRNEGPPGWQVAFFHISLHIEMELPQRQRGAPSPWLYSTLQRSSTVAVYRHQLGAAWANQGNPSSPYWWLIASADGKPLDAIPPETGTCRC